ncbi:MAG: hypothetical protein ICV53_06935 [Flavisolibacter sp.]|nr:hypothetical protein [Flavisolibacter sp.]
MIIELREENTILPTKKGKIRRVPTANYHPHPCSISFLQLNGAPQPELY